MKQIAFLRKTNLKELRVHPITSVYATYGYSYNISSSVKHGFF